MTVALPLWAASVMRVVALERAGAGPSNTGDDIRVLARVDVVSNPALGCGVGRLMTARHDPAGGRPRPFAGARLRDAIWNPRAPDILVAATRDTCDAVPDEIRMGLPWIVLLPAWSCLQAEVPTILLGVTWNHGDDGDDGVPSPGWGGAQREAWFAARALYLLLKHAPPEELVALSREPRVR